MASRSPTWMVLLIGFQSGVRPRQVSSPCTRARVIAVSAAIAAVLGCAGVKEHGSVTGQGSGGPSTNVVSVGSAGAEGSGAVGGSGLGAAGAGGLPPACTTQCLDFPAAPIIDTGAPAGAASMFTGTATGAGPCITEPEDGALFPNNWLRPRVKFTPVAAAPLYEIRFHADVEVNDLVAYTTNTSWTMPKDIWLQLTVNARDKLITVTVRALGGGTSTVTFTIAPVAAAGSIVFWAAEPAQLNMAMSMLAPMATSLQGFAVGDEKTVTTLKSGDVQMQTRDQTNTLRAVTCIGCHNSTPDGESVAFLDSYPWSMAMAGVKAGRTGLAPTYLTPGGMDTLRQPGMGIFSFSRAHWTDGDRIIVSPYYLDAPCGMYNQGNPNVQLAWLDVEAPPAVGGCPVEGVQFGISPRTGDPRGAAKPTWSHDGQTIVYSSTNGNQDGRLSMGATDLYQVPYNDKKGGAATPLPGAADPAFEEYYPVFSPDDKLLVFDRVPAGGVMYANPLAELAVVRVGGDPNQKAVRLTANDPPACSGHVSPGVNNHWAKWAPGLSPGYQPAFFNGKTYYWLIFSSNRYGTPPVSALGAVVQVSQLYATAIVVSETSMEMSSAIYLWNQDSTTLNTTPAWDQFSIPIVQ